MKTASIFFPVNNKGGVGKTSFVKELSLHLARYYSTMFIDADHQQSGFFAFTGESLTCKPYETYLNLNSRKIIANDPSFFMFSNDLNYITTEVSKTELDLLSLPIGTFRLFSGDQSLEGKISKAEKKVVESLKNHEAIVVDLPPMIDSDIVLNNSISPIIKAFKSVGYDDFQVYPIAVSSPNDYVIEIAESKLKETLDTIANWGVDKSKVHPVFVINGVDMKNPDMAQYFEKHGLEANTKNNRIHLAIPNMPNVEDYALFPNDMDLEFFFPEMANLSYRVKEGSLTGSSDDLYRSTDEIGARYLAAFRRMVRFVRENNDDKGLPSYYTCDEGKLEKVKLDEELKDFLYENLCVLNQKIKREVFEADKPNNSVFSGGIFKDGFYFREKYSSFGVVYGLGWGNAKLDDISLDKAEIYMDVDLPKETYVEIVKELYLKLIELKNTRDDTIHGSKKDWITELAELSEVPEESSLLHLDEFLHESGISNVFIESIEENNVNRIGIVYNYRVRNKEGDEIFSPVETLEDLGQLVGKVMPYVVKGRPHPDL